MSTIVSSQELLRRAVRFISDERLDSPEKPLHALVDEAAMRFNLSPLDSEALYRLLKQDCSSSNSA